MAIVKEAYKALEAIVGPEYISDDPAVCEGYRSGPGGYEAGLGYLRDHYGLGKRIRREAWLSSKKRIKHWKLLWALNIYPTIPRSARAIGLDREDMRPVVVTKG
jgi:hypothetical protein